MTHLTTPKTCAYLAK